MSENEVAIIIRRLERIESKLDDAREEISALNERTKHAEHDIRLSHARISSLKKMLIGVLITVAAGAVKYAWAIIESVARKG